MIDLNIIVFEEQIEINNDVEHLCSQADLTMLSFLLEKDIKKYGGSQVQ